MANTLTGLLLGNLGSFCDYIWAYSGGKTILYNGHDTGRIPVSNGLSEKISKDLKKRGFKYVGAITIYSIFRPAASLMTMTRTVLAAKK